MRETLVFLGAVTFCMTAVFGLIWLVVNLPLVGLIAIIAVFAALLAAVQEAGEW